MSDKIHLEIVSSTEAPFKVSITELYIPAYYGEAGVLENHKPYISLMQPGEIFYTDIHDKKFYLYVKEGFVEVNNNKIVIISDTIEKGENLKKEEIEAKLAELDDRIKALQNKDMTEEELIAAPEKLEKAIADQKEYITKQAILAKLN
jgi:F-type H+-transporting ATPase subunit epsilon